MTKFITTPSDIDAGYSHSSIRTTLPGEPGNVSSGRPQQTRCQSADHKARLIIVPVTLRTARAFVAWTHRHLLPPQGAKFAVGVSTEDGTLVGVAIAGRSVARAFDDGFTIEVTRLATDGTPNACSALLRAAWRAAKAMGYRRLITYTRHDEPGTSLHAAGLCRVTDRPPRSGWDTPSRPRRPRGADSIGRTLWHIAISAPAVSREAQGG